ncbi:MAG: hypothetical protein ACKO24_06870 [Leptolyngbyaceae cyanobacterium]
MNPLTDVINSLDNPALPGAYAFDAIVYGAPGLDYGDDPDLAQYATFQTPTTGYQTRSIDLSDFADLPALPKWPFQASNVPINGLLRVPQGCGPFPLVLIAHGNHWPVENSTPGYGYLLDLLASHGMIAGSVDCNFLNGANWGESDGRAIVHLEQIKQFQIWNQQPDHPLFGKVDLSNIMIAGHSRGGEAIGHASYFNTLDAVVPNPGDPPVPLDGSSGLGPYHFNLKAVVAIAPTANQYQPVNGPIPITDNYVILHGSEDGDVWTFEGYQTYDQAHPIDLSAPTQPARGFKALVWIYGANHNFFNAVWPQEGSPSLSRAEQETITKVFISAIAQGVLLQRTDYLNLLKDADWGQQQGWLPETVTLVSQYQGSDRLFIAHYEEDTVPTTLSPPVQGRIDITGIAGRELFFNQNTQGNLYQQTRGFRADWNGSGQQFVIYLDPDGLPPHAFQVFSLRVGQSNDPKNLADHVLNFTIALSDGNQTHAVKAADFATLPYPAQIGREVWPNLRRSVMQTIRIPLSIFVDSGVDIQHLQTITFRFDQPMSDTNLFRGSLYFDDIQLCN